MRQHLWMIVLLLLMNNKMSVAQYKSKPVVIGYVGGYNGQLINPDSIDAKRLSHINYAFVDIKDNKAWLHNEQTDTINFRSLNSLKKKWAKPSATLPIRIYSEVRLGVKPEINAISTMVIALIAVVIVIASLVSKLSSSQGESAAPL